MELKQLSKSRNYATAVVLATGGFHFGYYLACFNPLFLPMFTGAFGYSKSRDEKLLDTYSGLTNMIFCFGCMVGVLVSGYLSDKFGRRVILYLGEIIALLSLIPNSFGNVTSIFVGRAVSGVVTGINSSMFSVIMAELLPNKVCGWGNGFAYTMITLSILIAYITQNIFSFDTIAKYWRAFYLWPVSISVLRLACFPLFIKTDTPKYLFNKHSSDRLLAEQKVLEAYQQIYVAEDAVAATKSAIEMFEKERAAGKVSFSSLFKGNLGKRLFSGAAVAFTQQISGINFLLFYSTSIFDGVKNGFGKTMTLVIGISNFVGSFLAIYLIEQKGRKFNLVVGLLLEGLCMFLLLIGIEAGALWLLVLACVIYIIGFAIGLGGTETAYIGEILPPVGVGLAFGVQWLCAAVLGIVFPIVTKAVGLTAMVGFFGIICILLVFVLDYLTIETKGKQEQAIVAEFENRKYRFMDFLRQNSIQEKSKDSRDWQPMPSAQREMTENQ